MPTGGEGRAGTQVTGVGLEEGLGAGTGDEARAKVGVEQAREILRSQGMLPPPVLELLEFLDLQQQGRHGRARERRRAA